MATAGSTGGPTGPKGSSGAGRSGPSEGTSESQKTQGSKPSASVDTSSTVSHVQSSPGGKTASAGQTQSTFEAPILVASEAEFTSPEFLYAMKQVGEKLTTTLSQKELEKLHAKNMDKNPQAQTMEMAQRIVNNTQTQPPADGEEPVLVDEQGKPLGKATVEALAAFHKISNMLIELGGQYQAILQGRQADSQQEVREATNEQERALDKKDDASKASKIFGWVGAIGGVVLASVALAAAIALSSVTFGAASPLVALAGFGLACAITGLVIHILAETGTLDKFATEVVAPMLDAWGVENPEMVARIAVSVTVAVIMIALAVVGLTRCNAASLATVPGAVMRAFNTGMMIAQQVMNVVVTVGRAASDITAGVYSYKASEAEADKTEEEAILNHLQFMMEEMTKKLLILMEFIGKLSKEASKQIQSDTLTMTQILSNMA